METDIYDVPDTDPRESFNGHMGGLTCYDLAGLMRKGVTEPAVLDGLIYPGKIHALTGPPEAGKSVLSLWLAWQVMQRGSNVVVVDEEAGPSATAAILLGFGADPDLIEKCLSYVPFPGLRWGDGDLGGLHRLLAAAQPKLSIWDSAGALMGSSGMDENSSRDVTNFWYRVLMPVSRDFRCAVLLTDHDAKDGAESRYARGSTAKLAVVDVMLKLAPVVPFSRIRDGLVNLTVTKDRPGYLHRNYRIRYLHSPLRLEFAKSAPAGASIDGTPPGAANLAAVLNEKPASIKELVDRLVEAGNYPLKPDTASRYLNLLLDRGEADRIDQGNGRPALWIKPPTDEPGISPPEVPTDDPTD